jgi:hypothetical protein
MVKTWSNKPAAGNAGIGLFLPLVRDARWSKLKISDDPSIYGYDPDERLTFVTWDELGSEPFGGTRS